MPLCWVNSVDKWKPAMHETLSRLSSDCGLATLVIGRRLTSAVSIAVNKVDGRTGDRIVEEGHVRVDFGLTDRFTINGSPVQIIIAPGNNGLAPQSIEAQRRRCDIRDLVEEQLQALFREQSGYRWPTYDLEIIPLDMSGHASGPNGVERPWGNPRAVVLPRTVRATDELLD